MMKPSRLLSILIMLLPSVIKVKILKLLGHKIGKNVRIGFSLMDIKKIDISENSTIGHLNFFKNLDKLEIGSNSTIGNFNIFTSSNYYKKISKNNIGFLKIGNNTAITMRHYFDIQNKITIGDFSLIAGLQTIVFTHQKGIQILNEAKPINIGSHVYIGAACRIMPGTNIGNYIFIGGGNIISGRLDEEYSLYTTYRIMKVKTLPNNIPFFTSSSSTSRNQKE